MLDVKTLIKTIMSLWTLFIKTAKKNYAVRGIKACMSAIRQIRHEQRTRASIREKRSLETKIRYIESLRKKFNTKIIRVRWEDRQSAFKGRMRTGVIINLKHKDPLSFLEDAMCIFNCRIREALKLHESIKVNVYFCGEFEVVKGDQVLSEIKRFTTPSSPVFKFTKEKEWFLQNVIRPIISELEEFQEKDSGWTLKHAKKLGVNIDKFTQLLCGTYVELPRQIQLKKACINVKNDDNACFAWAVVSALYPADKNPQRSSKYPPYSEVLKLQGIQFPMTIKQIPRFERQNDISINVYILRLKGKSYTTFPSYLTKNKLDKHVNLLLVQNDYTNNGTPVQYHYVWIKNLSRLVSSQLSNEGNQKFICDRCLCYFRSKEKLDNHSEIHHERNCTALRMPEPPKNILRFKNYKNKEKVPFIIYADLESVLKPITGQQNYQEHEAAAVGYYVKCSYNNSLSRYRSHLGLNCMRWFADELSVLARKIEKLHYCINAIDMSSQQETEFETATCCHICGIPFEPSETRVRDHDHLIPKNNYRGAAHNSCNINFKKTYTIPVVFHNLSGYDAHFILDELANRVEGKIDLLPITKERYIGFTKHYKGCQTHFRFIDSFRFMASPLDQLASYLEEFPNLKSQFKYASDEQINLLTMKGVLPYDYFDGIKRFEETSLPAIEKFYNKLEEKKCPRKKYERAKVMWDKFKCGNLGEYLNLYMKSDVLLLADVFEQFRNSCQITYQLDPAHYYTLPGFTWDAMLKHTKQDLELLTDVDMFLFVEQGIRGGLSQVCSKRRVHANNKYLPTYDANKTENYLMYFDINNQYGWAMSQYLPYGGFEWTDNSDIDVTEIPDNSPEGYILEVDLDYPTELHDKHKDLPFCPQHMDSKTRIPGVASQPNVKLMATLSPKRNYVIHYRSLKQALKNGLVLSKIHKVLKFKQSAWLQTYIDLNTEHRKKSKNEFEKNLFKLMNNAIFGKTIENLRKRVDVRLLTKWEGRYGCEAYIAKPEFKNRVVFNENLVAVELRKLELYLDKPIYVGMSILDLAKTTIFNFHFDYMRNTFGDNCIALYTDTDSLIYELFKDPYEIIKRDCHKHFDTSDYPVNNPYGIPQVNKKILGMMKDENNGVPMTDYVGLRAKLYAFKNTATDDEITAKRRQWEMEQYEADEIECMIKNYEVTKKAKGVKKNVLRNNISFEDYIHCLEMWKEKVISQNVIKSKKHHVYTITQKKIGLSPYDDKRYLVDGTFNTLPWGHHSINEDEMDTS